jgi:hypothetical protein
MLYIASADPAKTTFLLEIHRASTVRFWNEQLHCKSCPSFTIFSPFCYSLRRPPPEAMSFSSLLGKPWHKPSTFRLALMSATTLLRRASYSGRVSSQAWAGVVCARRWRIHATAVSCSITSCIWPGCTEAYTSTVKHLVVYCPAVLKLMVWHKVGPSGIVAPH